VIRRPVLPVASTKGTCWERPSGDECRAAHCVAVGDTHNDLSLFAVAEIGVAVADAVDPGADTPVSLSTAGTAPASPSCLAGTSLDGAWLVPAPISPAGLSFR
jgi:haloacid dehalogenase-like hydrolase